MLQLKVVERTHKHGKQLLVDMIAVQDLEKRAKENR